MDVFHPETVFSSIDRQGRYAWHKQPEMAHWNMAQLAQALGPVLGDNAEAEAQGALDLFAPAFSKAFHRGFAAKIGIDEDTPELRTLVNELMTAMVQEGVDFTLFFRHLTSGVTTGDFSNLLAMFTNPEQINTWFERWDASNADAELMQKVNPVFIPRNHRIEEAIAAANNGDLEPFERLHSVLAHPYTEQLEYVEYENAPKPKEVVQATFCGT